MRPLRQPHAGDSQTTLHKEPYRKGFFLASDDPPPLAGAQLVRPRRYAAAGAPAGPLPHGRRDQGQLRERSRRTVRAPLPGDTIQVTGLKPYALLTVAALMGAASRADARADGRGTPASRRRRSHFDRVHSRTAQPLQGGAALPGQLERRVGCHRVGRSRGADQGVRRCSDPGRGSWIVTALTCCARWGLAQRRSLRGRAPRHLPAVAVRTPSRLRGPGRPQCLGVRADAGAGRPGRGQRGRREAVVLRGVRCRAARLGERSPIRDVQRHVRDGAADRRGDGRGLRWIVWAEPAAVPDSRHETWERVYPYSWLGILADVPPSTDESARWRFCSGQAVLT